VQCGGSVGSNERRQASVIDDVPLGFMSRIWIVFIDEPVTDGSSRGRDRESDI